MDYNLEDILEKLDSIRISLENQTNYAVIWLAETIDFLNNNDVAMALWSYGKYLDVLNDIDIDLFKQTGKILQEKLQEIQQQSNG